MCVKESGDKAVVNRVIAGAHIDIYFSSRNQCWYVWGCLVWVCAFGLCGFFLANSLVSYQNAGLEGNSV